jgi:hypothetical protein
VDAGFPTRSCTAKNAYDPEKWTPVFRQDHAPLKMLMIRKSGGRFSDKIMQAKKSCGRGRRSPPPEFDREFG